MIPISPQFHIVKRWQIERDGIDGASVVLGLHRIEGEAQDAAAAIPGARVVLKYLLERKDVVMTWVPLAQFDDEESAKDALKNELANTADLPIE